MTTSPYAAAAPELTALGYSPLPAMPADAAHQGRGKAPATYIAGGWRGLAGWSKYATVEPSSFERSGWLKAAGGNVGVVLGSPAGQSPEGEPLFAAVIDIDSGDPSIVDALVRAVPHSPMARRAAKGQAIFVRVPAALKSRSYDGPNGRILDFLAAGRFCVCPPSRHPTGADYIWLRGPAPASELPIFDAEDLAALEETLEICGWVRDPTPPDRPARPSAGAPREEDDDWAEANEAALRRLDDWFPTLGLHGTRRKSGGWEAVPEWRASSTGRALADRKRNLSAIPSGIRDWGADAGLTAIDVVERALGVTPAEALAWLRDRLDLDANGVVVDFSAMLANRAGSDAKTPPACLADGAPGGVGRSSGEIAPSRTATATHTELPERLLEVPGLVGEIAAWMGRIAIRPLPPLNLAAALCVVGTAAARKWATPLDGGTHLYVLGTAPTGSGKELPRRAGTHLLNAAGLQHLIAPSSFMSASALIQTIQRKPACVSFSDEVAEFLAKLNSAKASTHERAISGAMRELWGINYGTYTPPGWAEARDRAQPQPIHAPAFSFLGLSVPDAVWDALTGSDVVNGFLNRFLLVSTADQPIEQDPDESIFDVPQDLLDRLRALAAYGPPLTSVTLHMDGAHAPLVRVPWADGRQGEAAGVFKAMREHCRTHPKGESLMKRTAEIALRLATIRAIGIAGPDAQVTVADMEWGRGVALWSSERLIADSAAFLSETEYQAKAKFVLRCITDAPGGRITRTALCKKVAHRFPARDLDAILKGLIEAQDIADNSSRSGRRGPEVLTYAAA